MSNLLLGIQEYKEVTGRSLVNDYLELEKEIKSNSRRRMKKKKQHIPSSIRWAVWERDNFTCQKFGKRNNLSIDHIKPEVKGGKIKLSNLQTLCVNCNSKKGIKYYGK